MQSEVKRYAKWYQINPYQKDQYDLAYDTTGKTIETVLKDLSNTIRENFSGKKIDSNGENQRLIFGGVAGKK